MSAPTNQLAFDPEVALAAAKRWDSRTPRHEAFDEAARERRFSDLDTSERMAKRANRLLRRMRATAPGLVTAVAADLAGAEAYTVVGRAVTEAAVSPDLVSNQILERVLGATRDFQFVEFFAQALFASRSVGRVVTKIGGGRVSYGTGFLVSPRLLLTNHHVLESRADAARSEVEFNYQRDRLGAALPVARFRLEPGAFFLNDKDLDFALVAVAETSAGRGLREFGWCPLIKDEGKIVVGEPINIVQHPRGEMKQVVVRENRLIDLLDQFAHYEADTEPGSSGSPVFNDQWEVVALHHSGVAKRNNKGEFLTTDGRVWKPGDDPTRLAWEANEGVRVSTLVEFIARANVPASARALLTQLLDAKAPPEATEAGRAGPAAPPDLVLPPVPDPQVTTMPDLKLTAGGVTLTIPLQITVTLGAPALAGGPDSLVVPGPAEGLDAREKIIPDPSDRQYKRRPGYKPDFLGAGLSVPLPKLTAGIKAQAFALPGVNGDAKFELKYHHYSVLFNKARKLAFVSAVNYDPLAPTIARDKDGDKWFFDPRVPKEIQAGDGLYSNNDFDRGHLTRRADAGWGAGGEAKLANDDTFHFTNCSPQHFVTNQGKSNQAPPGLKLWGKLEDYVAAQGKANRSRLCVFNGPVFRSTDKMYRGICQIPLDYWKLIAFRRDDGTLGAAAFVLTQATLVGDLLEEFTPGEFKTVQKSVADLEGLTRLDFGPLRAQDVLNRDGAEERFEEGADAIAIESVEDVVL
ncbi:DNA/RNA non-specific endonuclease [Gemmata sp. JC717]|uniref:DNA/RNA non-specific endonuclease n=1 Tax=Gemmata algarum TaxID=2975278 RepID=UPI0021BA4CBE|nr:DNA/RNA non-specific endonuclease [Gemmata algarum]MDY3553809.1 DNA/RNA non-specific endonuclease [Gemmata algarum]